MLLFLIGAGSYPSSVSNSLKASKLAINQQVAPIQEFNQRYFAHVVVNICLLFFPLALALIQYV